MPSYAQMLRRRRPKAPTGAVDSNGLTDNSGKILVDFANVQLVSFGNLSQALTKGASTLYTHDGQRLVGRDGGIFNPTSALFREDSNGTRSYLLDHTGNRMVQ